MKLFSTVLFGCIILGLWISACTTQPTPVPTLDPFTPPSGTRYPAPTQGSIHTAVPLPTTGPASPAP